MTGRVLVDRFNAYIALQVNLYNIERYRWQTVAYDNVLWDGFKVESEVGSTKIVQGFIMSELTPVDYDRNVNFNANLIVDEPFIISRGSDRLLLSATKTIKEAVGYFYKLGDEPAENWDELASEAGMHQLGHQHGTWWGFLFGTDIIHGSFPIYDAMFECMKQIADVRLPAWELYMKTYREGFFKGIQDPFGSLYNEYDPPVKQRSIMQRPLAPIPRWLYNNKWVDAREDWLEWWGYTDAAKTDDDDEDNT